MAEPPGKPIVLGTRGSYIYWRAKIAVPLLKLWKMGFQWTGGRGTERRKVVLLIQREHLHGGNSITMTTFRLLP